MDSQDKKKKKNFKIAASVQEALSASESVPAPSVPVAEPVAAPKKKRQPKIVPPAPAPAPVPAPAPIPEAPPVEKPKKRNFKISAEVQAALAAPEPASAEKPKKRNFKISADVQAALTAPTPPPAPEPVKKERKKRQPKVVAVPKVVPVEVSPKAVEAFEPTIKINDEDVLVVRVRKFAHNGTSYYLNSAKDKVYTIGKDGQPFQYHGRWNRETDTIDTEFPDSDQEN